MQSLISYYVLHLTAAQTKICRISGSCLCLYELYVYVRTTRIREERGLSSQAVVRDSFREFSRASTEKFPIWFVDIRIYPAVQRVNGLFIFLKLYLFWIFLPWNMGDQPKVLKRRKKKEVSKFLFLCCIFLAGCFPLEPTSSGLWLLGSRRLM